MGLGREIVLYLSCIKKAKDVVEKSLNQAAEEIQDSQRKKSQNPPENGMPHQQPPYQAEGDRPGQAPSENFSGGYQPPPGRVYTTPPPQNNQTSGRKQTPPYQVYEPIKTKRQKKGELQKACAPGNDGSTAKISRLLLWGRFVCAFLGPGGAYLSAE